MSLLDHPLISQRYFFPRTDSVRDPVIVPSEAGPLRCWRSGPPSERPVLVHFHGNGEVVADWIDFFRPFCDALGYDVFLAEYRGYGGSAGVPELGAMLDDLQAVADVVGVPAGNTVVFGQSVGSIYAIEWVRQFPTTAGLVIESGIHDVLQRLLLRVEPEELGATLAEFRSAAAERVDHAQKLADYPGPSLFLHAQGDDLVTPDHAAANAHTAQNPHLVVLPNGDHNSILAENFRAYAQTLGDFLVERYPSPVPTPVLHRLLATPHHRSHQLVLRTLQRRADPTSVEHLQAALERGFGMLEYTASDDGVIAKWFSWTLWAIGTPPARALAEVWAAADNHEIAEEMRYRLSKWQER